MTAGEDLYRLDSGALAELDADLVVTQDLCAVCAVDVATVDDALSFLGLPSRGRDHRPAHPRRRAGLDHRGRPADRPGRPRPSDVVASLEARLAAVEPNGSPGGRGRACWSWSGPTHPSRRGTGSRRWSPGPAASPPSASPARGRAGSRGTRPRLPPRPRRVRALRLRPRGQRGARRRTYATASPACRSGPSTPTGTSPARDRGWSTGSRCWPEILHPESALRVSSRPPEDGPADLRRPLAGGPGCGGGGGAATSRGGAPRGDTRPGDRALRRPAGPAPRRLTRGHPPPGGDRPTPARLV